MENKAKIARHFSAPLMKQNVRSNWALTVVIMVIACMMSTVIYFAMNIMGVSNVKDTAEMQDDFYAHLSGMATYNQMTGSSLSAEDFIATTDKAAYEAAFGTISAQSGDLDLSVEGFEAAIEALADADGSVAGYVRQFEYIYALMDEQGVFTGERLDAQGMLETMLSGMGISSDRITMMAEMDSTAILNKMYFTVMGLLPLLLFVVIVGNSLIANQVDSGSMAYVLATPTKRSAVANTQAVFLLVSPLAICAVVCMVRIFVSTMLNGEGNVAMNIALYFGMYVLIEAISGICYMGSCLFNQSRKATAFGGGVAVWCFLASLLGMFGTEDMVAMGAGVEELNIFNKLTLIGLYDIQSLSTVGSGDVDDAFVWKLCVLAGVAGVSYAVGKIRFQEKDLPL